MAIGDLNTIHKVAIKKVITDGVFDAARALLTPGKYETDVAIRVAGSIKVGDPYPQSIALTFPWQRLALMLATRVPRHVLDSVLRELHSEDAIEDLKTHVLNMWAEIKAGSTQECNGKVTSQLTVELVDKVA